MGARQNTPLFELLEGERAAADAPRPIAVEAKPGRTVLASSPRGGEARESPPPSASSPRFAGEFRAPKVWVYAAGAGVLLLMIVVWSLGVVYGESRADSRYAAGLTSSLPTPLEPDAGPSREASQTLTASSQAAPTAPADGGSRGAETPLGGSIHLTSLGVVPTDPREPGSNYLKLASDVGRAQAEGVIAFLAARQVEIVGVPAEGPGGGVDRAGRGANNRDRFDLYSLYGVPSSRFSTSSAERRRHQDRLKSLGRDWLKRPEGLINFDRTQWTKFDG